MADNMCEEAQEPSEIQEEDIAEMSEPRHSQVDAVKGVTGIKGCQTESLLPPRDPSRGTPIDIPRPVSLSVDPVDQKVTFSRVESVVEVSNEFSNELSSREGLVHYTMRTQFDGRGFTLRYDKPWHLVLDQWGYPSLYLVWRELWAQYHLVMTVCDMFDNASRKERPVVWVAYEANWAYLLLTLSALLQAVVSLFIACRQTGMQAGSLKWYLKVSWLMYEMTSVNAILTTILYAGYVYNPSKASHQTFLSVNKHFLGTGYVLLDLLLTAMPIRLLHCVYSSLFVGLCLGYTAMYQAVGSTMPDKYQLKFGILDWSQTSKGLAQTAGISLVGGSLVHALLFGLHLGRRMLHKTCCLGSKSLKERVFHRRMKRSSSCPPSPQT